MTSLWTPGPPDRRLAIEVSGSGPAVVLVHGFASNHAVNWVSTGWTADLERAGFRAVAFDNLGHGRSATPRSIDAYAPERMADDVLRVMDMAGAERAAILGYSMGARIALRLALRAPSRVAALVLGGVGANLLEGLRDGDEIADALVAPEASTITSPNAMAFRVFAERTGSDREALAACMRGMRQAFTDAEFAGVAAPTLIVAGDKDAIAGDPQALARVVPGSRLVRLEGRDHMSAVGDRTHRRAAVEFLSALRDATSDDPRDGWSRAR